MKYKPVSGPLENKSPSYGGIFDFARMTAQLEELDAQEPSSERAGRVGKQGERNRPAHVSGA